MAVPSIVYANEIVFADSKHDTHGCLHQYSSKNPNLYNGLLDVLRRLELAEKSFSRMVFTAPISGYYQVTGNIILKNGQMVSQSKGSAGQFVVSVKAGDTIGGSFNSVYKLNGP